MTTSPIIEIIQSKIDLLIEDNDRLRVENGKLLEQRDRLTSKNRKLEEKMAEVDRRVGVLELKKSFASGGENQKLARARVNRLMREVDRCIALLNR